MGKSKKLFTFILTVTLIICQFSLTKPINVSAAPHKHNYVDDVCTECGRITNAVINGTYQLETTADNLFQVVEYTALKDCSISFYCDSGSYYFDAYGYVYDNLTTLEADLANHPSGGRLSKYLEYDDDNGSNGSPNVVVDVVEGKTYYFVLGAYSAGEYGSSTLTISCNHGASYYENRTLESCLEGGYSGDEYCLHCDEFLSSGTTISPGEHTYDSGNITQDSTCTLPRITEYTCLYCNDSYKEEGSIDASNHYTHLINYKYPTCTESGYSGDDYCLWCKSVISEGEEILPIHSDTTSAFLIHDINTCPGNCIVDGNTGDTICSICDEVLVSGTITQAPGSHDFVDGFCSECGLNKYFLGKEKYLEESGQYLIYNEEDFLNYLNYAEYGITAVVLDTIDLTETDFAYDTTQYNLIGGKLSIASSKHKIITSRPIFNNIYNAEIIYVNIEAPLCFYEDAYSGILANNIYNSTISNCNINASVNLSYECSFGGFSNYAVNSSFNSCCSTIDVYGDDTSEYTAEVGLFVGYSLYSNFELCESYGSITCDFYEWNEIAGIVGDAYYTNFINCKNYADFSGDFEDVGGIVGDLNNGSIINCTNHGKIDSGEDDIGGIVGITNCAIIEGCENNGDIYGDDDVGGIVGDLDMGNGANELIIKDCTNNGSVSGDDQVGGIAGCGNSSLLTPISNCSNYGNVDGDKEVGGILGYSFENTVNNCSNHGNINGNNFVGGIAGCSGISDYDYVFNTGTISSTNNNATIANLVNAEDSSFPINITNSSGAHTHNQSGYKVITAADTKTDGKYIPLCNCSLEYNPIVINRIDTVKFDNSSLTYEGKALVLPSVVITDSKNNIITTDYYNVVFTDSNGKIINQITKAGVIYATITFKDKYTGTVTLQTEVKNSTSDNVIVANKVAVKAAGYNGKTIYSLAKKKISLKSSVLPSAASQSVTYKSSNTSVATVNKNGIIKTKKAGKATITITTINNKKATIKVVVVKKAKKNKKLSLKKKTIKLKKKGSSAVIGIKALTKKTTDKITYKVVSGKKYVKVDKFGTVVSKIAPKKKARTAKIKVTCGKVSKIVKVIIKK